MKKLLVLMMVFGLILGSIATAEAGKKKKKAPPAPVKVERVVEFEYVCPCPGVLQLGTLLSPTHLGGGPVAIQAGEVFVTAVADDMSGQAIPVSLNQDLDGDGGNNSVGSFCGETTEPISLTEGLEIRVFIGNPTICAGPAAGGTITFTLSNMP